MALPDLAAPADLTARGITSTGAEAALVATWLAESSAAIRDAAGVPITQVNSTVDLPGPSGQWLTLPGPPVTGVTTVKIDGVTLAAADWRRDGDQLWRAGGWQAICGQPSTVTVTYTHGLPTVPVDIVGLCCALVAAALVASRAAADGSGHAAPGQVTSERIGDYAVSYADEGRPETVISLSETTRNRLRARFGGSAGVHQLR